MILTLEVKKGIRNEQVQHQKGENSVNSYHLKQKGKLNCYCREALQKIKNRTL